MRFIFLVLAILTAGTVAAQLQLKGKVSTADNQPLPGATVRIEGSTLGTVTDPQGLFSLAPLTPGRVQLEVSFIGYETIKQELLLRNDTTLAFTLHEEAVLTEEVFVYATRAGSSTPVTSTRVEKAALEQRNLGQDIPYLLNTTPSFVSTSDAGTGIGYTGFRIRGTDANRINVSINGVPVNDAESHGVFWVNMPDFGSSIESVQVQRGVGTSTNGAAAFGGTINMQTNTLRKEAYAEYNGAAGSFSTFKNTVSIGSGLINEHFSFDARLSKITTDGFIDRAWSDLKSFFVSGGYYAGNTIIKVNIFSGIEKTYQAWNGVPKVRLNNDMEGMQRYEDHWLYSPRQTSEMINSDARTYNLYTYENETDNYQQDHYQLLFSHQFGDYINFNTALHYTYGRGYYEQFREDDDFEDYGLDNVVTGSDTITSTDLVRQKWLDNDFYGATFSLSYLKEKVDFTLGGGWNRYQGRHFGNITWAQFLGTTEKDFEWYNNTGIKSDFNVYGKLNYRLSAAFNLYADLQYRNIMYSIDGMDDDFRDLTQDHDYDFINPKLGLYYAPSASSSAYLSWAVGHREPSRTTLVDTDSDMSEPRPETLNDFEAGYKYTDNRLSAGVNIYYMLYDDQLILTGEINDVGSPILVNVDNSYRAGLELVAGARLLPNLKWEANATLSRNEISNFTEYVDNWDEGGQSAFEHGNTTIAFSPSLIANSMLSYEAVKHLELNLISQYVGKQYIDNSASSARMLNAYLVNNLGITYSLFPQKIKEIQFTLLINNLLNAEYETNAWVYSYILGGERYEMDGYFPQAGINFLAGINIRF
ncbi:TonB-dependent receptor [Roseimarinus sediminis]|uniref:TonB-dependent receptor n=1 Tax=Roseimarinus sediminis TaxID=1610899 RepID=UPI003D1F60D3